MSMYTKNLFFNKLAFVVICCLLNAISFAKEKRLTTTNNGGQVAQYATMSIFDDETALPGSYYTVRNETMIELKIDDYLEPFYWYDYNIKIKVTPYYSQYGSSQPYSITMKIENNRYGGMGQFVDFQKYKIPDAGYGAVIEIEDIQVTNLETSVVTTISPDNITLTLAFESERYYMLPASPNYGISSVVNSTYNTLTINWANITTAEEYDLEWTWVDDYNSTNAGALNPSNIALTDRNFQKNCTRIQTVNNSYSIPLIYSRGYIVYRVRAVGRFPDSDYHKKLYCSWSSDATYPHNAVSNWGSSHYKLISEHENAKKNWQFQASYAEEGKKKEVVSYFDGSLRNRQTVTKINSNNTAIVGEVIYDEEGRPAIEILPSPTELPALKYFSDFNRSVNNDYVYSYKETMPANETQPCVVLPPALSSNYGAGKYYSTNVNPADNYMDYVPVSNGYPFSQIEYTPDNTGRVKRKGGVGIAHQLGTNHEMKYIYSVPSQEELNRLFGYSVGFVSHYKKNVVVDPNNQVSVSYLDPQGRTIATALASDNPANLTQLYDEADNSQHVNTTIDLLNKLSPTAYDTDLDNNVKFLSSNYYGNLNDGLRYDAQKALINESGVYTFNYSMNKSTAFSYLCQSTTYNYPFIYKLDIDITNECGAPLIDYHQDLGSYTMTNGMVNLVSASTATTHTSAPNALTIQPPLGNYGISKKLTVDQAALDVFANDYITRGIQQGCILGPQAPQADTSGCFYTCQECVDYYTNVVTQFGYLTENLASNFELNQLTPGTQQYVDLQNLLTVRYLREWELIVEECQKPCMPDGYVVNPATSGQNLSSMNCDNALSSLMSDIMPSGQYGVYISNVDSQGNVVPSTTAPDIASLPMSVYNETNSIYAVVEGTNPNEVSWRYPHYFGDLGSGAPNNNYKHYFTETGTIDYVFVTLDPDTGTYTPPVLGAQYLQQVEDNTYKTEPQYLANVQDFINLIVTRPNWTRSLVKYHPEYHYLDYKYTACPLVKTVQFSIDDQAGIDNVEVNSDGFDALIGSINTYDEAVAAGFLASPTTLLTNDPFFAFAHPMDATIVDVTSVGADGVEVITPTNVTKEKFLQVKRSIMERALNKTSVFEITAPVNVTSANAYGSDSTGFEDTEKTMFRVVYETIKCNGLDFSCDLPANATFANIITAIGNSTQEEKDKFWQYYVSYYLSLKQKIQHTFINLHAARQGFYNDCIGVSGENTGTITAVLNKYGQEKSAVDGWISVPNDTFFEQNGNFVTEKEKRFLPYDEQYESEQSTSQIYEELQGIVNAQTYQETGQCPMLRDMQIFLDGAVKKAGLTTVFSGGTPSVPQPVINFITPALFQSVGANYSSTNYATNSFVISGVISNAGKTLSIYFTQSPASPSFQPIELIIPSNSPLTWNTYGSTWKLEGMSQIAGTGYSAPTQQYGFWILGNVKPLSPAGPNIDQVIVGRTKAIITCVNNPDYSPDPLLGPNPEVIGQVESTCDRKGQFSTALTTLMQNLQGTGTLNSTAGINIVNNTAFANGFLPEFFSTANIGVVQWEHIPSLSTYILRTGVDATSTIARMRLNLNVVGQIISVTVLGPTPDGTGHYVLSMQMSGLIIVPVMGTITSALNTEPLDFACCRISNFDYHTPEEFFTLSEQVYNELIDLYVYCEENEIPMPSTYNSPAVEALSVFYDTDEFGIYNLAADASGGYYYINFTHSPELSGDNGYCYIPVSIVSNVPFDHSIWIEAVTNSDYHYIPPPMGTYAIFEYYTFEMSNGYLNTRGILRNACLKTMSDLPSCPCVPQQVLPIEAEPMFAIYTAHLANFGLTNYLTHPDYTPLELFKGFHMQYIVDGYMYYLTALGITAANYQTHPQYISMSAFGGSALNYGYNDYHHVIDEFVAQLGNSNAIPVWSEFVEEYLESRNDICPPAPMIPTITLTVEVENLCQEFILSVAETYDAAAYNAYIQAKKDEFKKAYLEKALGEVSEQFTMTYFDKEYQYTLYYYDQAGNLTQTIAPQGVVRLGNSYNNSINSHRMNNPASDNTSLLPSHSFKTQYKYNTLNQLVWQKTPDGGETRFAYDDLGRIVASQNANQAAENPKKYSYTRYDKLGRIFESGVLGANTVTINNLGRLVYTSNGALVPVDADPSTYNYPFNISTTQYEVTRTYYDNYGPFNPDMYLTPQTTRNTRNRVTAILSFPQLTSSTNLNTFETCIFYNYDIHGSVDEMTQVIQLWGTTLKNTVNYEYDLISGNVNQVIYQKGRQDQFMHKYSYDADNRITSVATSKDGMIWENEADYEYYEHGPLARTVLGDKKVQGIDYAYTLQGWLKVVNSENFDSADNDMGRDGNHVSKDATGFSLSYFTDGYGDYRPRVDSNYPNVLRVGEEFNPTAISGTNLYNGNIKRMSTTIRELDESARLTAMNLYKYDQLNRISFMQSYDVVNTEDQYHVYSSIHSYYTYDKNGNIQKLNRTAPKNGVITEMDQLEYIYPNGTNQLQRIVDNPALTGIFSEDIDLQGFTTNYEYDNIGQLKKDNTEKLLIDWRYDGKVKKIENQLTGNTIYFAYDGLGNRIGKNVSSPSGTVPNFYGLDAQGNVLAVYKGNTAIEHHIYGSSRLGIEEYPEINVNPEFANRVVGDKRYELSNHLGNVLNVITDRKIIKDYGFEYPLYEDPYFERWYANGTAEIGVTDTTLKVVSYDPYGAYGVYDLPANNPVKVTFDIDLYGATDVYFYVALPDGTIYNNLTPMVTGSSFTFTFNPPVDGTYRFFVEHMDYNNSPTFFLSNFIIWKANQEIPDDDFYATFLPDVISASDYYPFGMLVPERHHTDTRYRYGFQGQEKDDEVKGEGNSLNYTFRMHDPRVGRFFATDPLEKKYPFFSPYQFSANTPIMAVELEGLESSNDPNQTQKPVTVGSSGTYQANFFGNRDLIINPSNEFNNNDAFQILTQYGYDPGNESSVDMLSEKFLEEVKKTISEKITGKISPEKQFKALATLGFNVNQVDEIMDFYKQVGPGVSPYDVLSSIAGLASNDNFLDNFPIIGSVVSLFTKQYESDKRRDYNMIKWNLAKNKKDPYKILKFDDNSENPLSGMVFIYSNKDLTKVTNAHLVQKQNKRLYSQYQYELGDGQLDYLNIGAQYGNNIYIFSSFKLKK